MGTGEYSAEGTIKSLLHHVLIIISSIAPMMMLSSEGEGDGKQGITSSCALFISIAH